MTTPNHAAAAEKNPRPSRWASSHLWTFAAVLFVFLACTRIVATYKAFSQTSDEAAHISCGMELLSDRAYNYETQHPPVARVMTALPLFLHGIRTQHKPDFDSEGAALLNSGDYWTNLARARSGVLPFFLITCAVIFIWTARIADRATAFLAVAIFASVPTVLAHAGLATTDMGATAGVICAVVMFLYWRENPTIERSILFGIVFAVAVLTKFSVIGFVVIAFVVLWWVQRKRGMPKASSASIRAAIYAMLLAMWACYGFSTSSFFVAHPRAAANLAEKSPKLYALASANFPLAQIPSGIAELTRHMREGHPSYFLGHARTKGTPLFFPVVFMVKTPIPLIVLLFTAIGIFIADYRRRGEVRPLWYPLLVGLAIFASVVPSRINIGLRHILPVYPMFAIGAAIAAMYLIRSRATRRWVGTLVVVALVSWQAVRTWEVCPEYLTYFNEAAGRDPQWIVVDSDFDWGQDVSKLGPWCKEHHVEHIWVATLGKPDFAALGLPSATYLKPFEPKTGFVAIGESRLKIDRLFLGKALHQGGAFDWLKPYRPVARVGKTILLYQIPDGSTPEISAEK